MPPKAKKGKKSKAEKEAERLQKEEDEKREAEAEAKRVEEARIAQVALEKKQKEEAAQQRKEEIERLGTDYAEAVPFEKNKVQTLVDAEAKTEEGEGWKAYLECEPKPDASIEKEMNSYITTWRSEDQPQFAKAMEECVYAGEIAADLNKVICNAQVREMTRKHETSLEFLVKLRQTIISKMDRTSAHYFENLEDQLQKNETKETVYLAMSEAGIKVGIWVNFVVKGYGRVKSLDWTKIPNQPSLGIIVDIPKILATHQCAIRVLQLPFDYLPHLSLIQLQKSLNGSTDDDPVSTTTQAPNDLSLGGFLFIEQLELPVAPHKVKGWTMRQITQLSKSVSRIAYPPDGHVTAAASALKVQYTIPPTVFVQDSIPVRVGWWNNTAQQWEEDGISEVSFHPDTRVLQFHTTQLTALSLIQRRHVDLKYESWSLKPVREFPEVEVKFALKTDRFEIEILVSGRHCRLTKPDFPELEALRSEWMPPAQLLTSLQKAGINIMPLDNDMSLLLADEETVIPTPTEGGEDSAPKGKRCLKAPLVERKIVKEMAALACSFDFSSSLWNRTVGKDNAVVLVKESMAFSGQDERPDDDHDYKSIFVQADGEVEGGVKMSIVSSTEEADDFFCDIVEGNQTKVYLRQSLFNSSTPEAMENVDRITEKTTVFEQTLRHLLQLVRPVSFQ